LDSGAADTEWVRIIGTGQKDGKTQVRTLHEILIEILDKFPSCDLLSEEGVAEARHDIAASSALSHHSES